MNYFQNILNEYSFSTIKRLELDLINKTITTAHRNIIYKNKIPLYNKPRDVSRCIQCPNVDDFSVSYLKYILQKIGKCLVYVLNEEELKIDESRTYISFYVVKRTLLFNTS